MKQICINFIIFSVSLLVVTNNDTDQWSSNCNKGGILKGSAAILNFINSLLRSKNKQMGTESHPPLIQRNKSVHPSKMFENHCRRLVQFFYFVNILKTDTHCMVLNFFQDISELSHFSHPSSILKLILHQRRIHKLLVFIFRLPINSLYGFKQNNFGSDMLSVLLAQCVSTTVAWPSGALACFQGCV